VGKSQNKVYSNNPHINILDELKHICEKITSIKVSKLLELVPNKLLKRLGSLSVKVLANRLLVRGSGNLDL
jgi:hypothetical protein